MHAPARYVTFGRTRRFFSGFVKDSVANFWDEIKSGKSKGIVDMWITFGLRRHVSVCEISAT